MMRRAMAHGAEGGCGLPRSARLLHAFASRVCRFALCRGAVAEAGRGFGERARISAWLSGKGTDPVSQAPGCRLYLALRGGGAPTTGGAGSAAASSSLDSSATTASRFLMSR